MGGVMLSSLQHRDTSEGGHEASMQFTAQTQQLTTCPQCDNVVRIDAEFCNICGKRLRPATAIAHPGMPLQTGQSLSSLALQVEVEEDDEEYIDEDEDVDEDVPGPAEKSARSQPIPPAPGEILSLLRRLQEQAMQMEQYFPADLPGKAQKVIAWKKQLQRALACAELFERPRLQ